MSTSDETQNWPQKKTYITTVIDYPIQRVHKVLRDFNQWEKWDTHYKNQEMLTPPPFDKSGTRRVVMTDDRRVRVWQELVGVDDFCFFLGISVLPYRKETEKYRAEGFRGCNEKSEVWVYPVTVDGNFGSVVEWTVCVNTEQTLEELDKMHQTFYTTLFKDIEAHLEKTSTKELNTFYSVKYLEEGKIQLSINVGTLLPESSGSLFAKIKTLLTTSKVTIVQENHPERENIEPSLFSVTYSDDHEATIAVRPVIIPGTGQAKRLMKGPVTTYVQVKHKLVVSGEAIDYSVASLQKLFQEFVTALN